MPKATVWIREEDYAKWQAIESKPEWLHKRINSKEAVVDLLNEKMDRAKREIVDELTDKSKDMGLSTTSYPSLTADDGSDPLKDLKRAQKSLRNETYVQPRYHGEDRNAKI